MALAFELPDLRLEQAPTASINLMTYKYIFMTLFIEIVNHYYTNV